MLAVGSWVIFDIYRGFTNTTLTEVQQQQILPLKVNIGDDLVAKMQARRQFDDFFLSAVQSRAVPVENRKGQTTSIIASPSAEIAPTPSEVATDSAVIESGVEASPSGVVGGGI